MRNGSLSTEQDCVDLARKTLQKILEEEFGGRGKIVQVEQATDFVEGKIPVAVVLQLNGAYLGESLNVYVLENKSFLVTRTAISIEKEVYKFQTYKHGLYNGLIEVVDEMS